MLRLKLLNSLFFCGFAILASGGVCRANDSAPDSATHSDFQKMTGRALRQVFSGTKMIGEYSDFRDRTQTYQYTEFHHQDGTTNYIEGGKAENGEWRIVGGDKVCYRYPQSKVYTGIYCFYVYKNDKCYYKYSPRNMGLKGPRDFDKWSSRAIRKGEGGTCAEPVS